MKFGPNLPGKDRTKGMTESRSHLYQNDMKNKTLIYLSLIPPSLSMMIVWNNSTLLRN